jgi:hypothetical protein
MTHGEANTGDGIQAGMTHRKADIARQGIIRHDARDASTGRLDTCKLDAGKQTEAGRMHAGMTHREAGKSRHGTHESKHRQI